MRWNWGIEMANQNGIVVESDGEWAMVATQRRDACGGCTPGHHCSACLPTARNLSKVRNTVGAGGGDQVMVSLDTGDLWKGAAILYLLPVAGLMLGAAAGHGLGLYFKIGESLLSVIFSLIGLGFGFVILTLVSKHAATKGRFIPKIIKILYAADHIVKFE